MPPGPPDPSDGVALDRLRRALDTTGYDATNLEPLLAADARGAFRDGWSNPARRRTEPTTPLSTLARLFALGFDVPASDLGAIPCADVSDWVVTGLVAVDRSTVHPLVSIQPYRTGEAELRLVSEVPNPSLGGPAFPDFVTGAGGWSSHLAKVTLRRPFHRALDLGTGNGVQALLAARHCEQVVATDVNPRALAFTRFNLVFNGVENVELRLGDRFEPVAGENFDLVVSNPPFVVSPAMTARFRDSGLATDTISETAVTGTAEHLAPGGWAQIMCQWVHNPGERWQDRVQRWVAGTGCDAWAVQRVAQDSVSHSVAWLTELGKADPEEADRQFEEWMRYFDSEGIAGLGTGFVVLRKAADRDPWFVASELGDEPADEAGEAVARFFDAQDWLRAHPRSGAILDTRWRLAGQIRLESFQEAMSQGAVTQHVLRQGAGLRMSAEVSRDLAEVVMRCDGSRTLRIIVEEHVKGRGEPGHQVEVEAAFSRLVETGFIEPVTD